VDCVPPCGINVPCIAECMNNLTTLYVECLRQAGVDEESVDCLDDCSAAGLECIGECGDLALFCAVDCLANFLSCTSTCEDDVFNPLG
jgi:hypothetical protein